MVYSRRLIVIGYWGGPEANDGPWPEVSDFIDNSWDVDERDFVKDYIGTGLIVRTYMGYSTCRLCGKRDNGDMELSDGYYVWPDGLVHYVREHGVRLPHAFVKHAFELTEALEKADRAFDWWRQAYLPRPPLALGDTEAQEGAVPPPARSTNTVIQPRY